MAAKKEKSTVTLFEMTEEMKALMEDIEMFSDEGGDVTDYPFERLDKLEGEIKDKVLKCAVMFKEWKRTGEAIKAEEENLAKRRKAHEGNGSRIRAYLESCLPANAKFEDARASVSWKKNPAAVEVLAPIAVIPEKFLRRKDPEVDKAELKACMQEFQIPETDDLGNPLFDTEGKPLIRTELQVRWPKPVQDAPLANDGDDDDLFPAAAEAPADPMDVDPNDLDKVFIVARMVQGKSLLIK